MLQELHGLLLARYMLPDLMYKAASRVEVDPDPISFVRARSLLPAYMLMLATHAVVYDRLVGAIAARLLPPREERTNP